jgi:hypothetical protein
MRVMRAAGTNPTITVKLERSNDGLNWSDKHLLFSGVTLANGVSYAQDIGAVARGCFGRLSVQLGGTSPSAHVQLIVTAWSVFAYAPTDLAGLVLWLRADLGITLRARGRSPRREALPGRGRREGRGPDPPARHRCRPSSRRRAVERVDA